MLAVLLATGYAAVFNFENFYGQTPGVDAAASIKVSAGTQPRRDRDRDMYFAVCVRRLALPQIFLAVLALTNFHVQIINRISSGYPVWYLVIALAIMKSHGDRGHQTKRSQKSTLDLITAVLNRRKTCQWIVRSMIMYAIIQGGLYASFMPPA